MSEAPPAWLLEKHGTVEAALLAADLAVVDAMAAVEATSNATRHALSRKTAAEAEFNALDRERLSAIDRFRNVKAHQQWVEQLACGRDREER